MTLAPLSERVAAPAELPLPVHPEVAEWRPIELADVDAIMRMQRAVDQADHPHWTTPREDVVDDLEASHLDRERDTLLALDADGAVLAWGIVSLGPGQDTRVQSYLFGAVHPEHRRRGIGGALLEWERARSLQQLASSPKTLPGWSLVYAEEQNAGLIALAERSGLRIARYFTEMERRTADPIPEPAVPDDVRLVPYSAELDESTRLARNDAFRDHWGSQPTVPERWAQFVGGEHFRPELSWLAVADDEQGRPRVVALALTTVNEDDWEARGYPNGYVALIAVVRSRRGQGLAPAVMAAQLRSFREAGLEAAVLDVDTENPSGALGLYERMGYVAGHRELALLAEV